MLHLYQEIRMKVYFGNLGFVKLFSRGNGGRRTQKKVTIEKEREALQGIECLEQGLNHDSLGRVQNRSSLISNANNSSFKLHGT